MSIDKLLSKEIVRRDFLVKSGKAAGWASPVATGLDSLVGCVGLSRETRQDVINHEWQTNDIVPIPKEGCYIGGDNSEGSFAMLRFAAINIGDFAANIGKLPAF